MINDKFHTAYCSYIQVSKPTAHKLFKQGRPVQVGLYGRGYIGDADILMTQMADKQKGVNAYDIDRIESNMQQYLHSSERLKYFVPVTPELDARAREKEHNSCGRNYHYNDTRMSYNQYVYQHMKGRI